MKEVMAQLRSRPPLTFREKLIYALFSQFRFGRQWIGGYWLKTHLMGYAPRGVWLTYTYDGFEAFKKMPDVLAIEVWN